MNCPKCGNTIYQGDITCGKCNYPVAMMSGEVKKTNIVQSSPISTQEINVPYIEPIEAPKPFITPPPPKPDMPKNKNTYSNYGEGKKAVTSLKFIFPILIGIIVLIFVLIGIFIFIKSLVSDKKSQELQEQITAYQVEFNNFLYEIPGNYTYQKESNTNTLYINDSNFSWEMSIQVINSTYSSVRSRKASLKSYFQSLGYQVSEIEEVEYGSTYLALEAKKKNKNYLLAVTKAGDSSKCFGISISTTENMIDYTYLEKASNILKNTKYQQNNKEKENKIDFNFANALK